MFDVIVIGAGYAGLTAARKLLAQGKKVLVLEARDRVGGRVYTKYLSDNLYVDLGGTWVGPTQDRIYGLLREFGIATFKTYDEGKSSLYFNGKVKHYKGLIPPLPVPSLLSLDFAIKKINKLSKSVNLQAPWESPHAARWDEMTLGTWMRQQMKFDTARTMFKLASEAIWAADPNEISMLHALFYAKSGGNLDRLMNVKQGAQEERIMGGASGPALAMAAEMNEHILLNHVVKNIRHSENAVQVSGDTFDYEAKHVVIALPPFAVQKIHFTPGLPAHKSQLFQRMPMGTVTKTFAIYDKPFWRAKGLNGLAATNDGYTSVTFDNSPKDGSVGIMMGFVLGNQAKAFANLSENERQKSILNSFASFYGEEARTPLQYLEHSWAEEEFTGGCYAGLFPPGLWTSVGRYIRTPTGRIHWAGTETATEWNGYIDGAIQSGERVAEEIKHRTL